jgi:phosphatidylglycerol:prolipoprotein diacylglycerol transferase
MDFTPNPVAFTLFGLDIRWYAILICAGMLIGCAIAYRRCPSRGILPDNMLDALLFSIPVGIIGARAWYVFFNRAYYHTFFDIINIRAGGLAIHGGLVFGLLTAYLVCRHKKISFLNIADTAVPCIALAQAIGRWGNFFNSEAHGSETNLPWAITVDGVKVHPTFLYESLWCFMLFFLLSYVDKRKKFNGQTLCMYAILYSAERFFVEELRTDSLLAGSSSLVTALQDAGYDPTSVDGVIHIGNFLIYPFKTAQLISIISIVAAIVIYSFLNKRHKNNKGEYIL